MLNISFFYKLLGNTVSGDIRDILQHQDV